MNPLAYIRLAAFAALAAFLAFFAYKVHSWRSDALQLGAVRQEMAALKASQAASQAASEGYQRELQDIRNRPVPSSPVRLCVKRPAVPAVGGGPSSAIPGSGVLPGANGTDPEVRGGPDIGPALRSLANRADAVSAQGRATQSLHLKGPR